MLADALRTVFDIAFDHKSLYQLFDIGILIAAVYDILCDTYLLKILLAGVVVVCIYDNGGIYKI